MNEEIIKSSSFEPMGCREVGSFLPLFVLGGRGMTLDECAAVKHHLQTCSRCARAYKETGFVVNLLQSQQEVLIERGLFSRPSPEEIDREPIIEESFEEFQDKLQRSKARVKRNIRTRRLKILLKTSAAVAACVVIGLFVFFISPVRPQHKQVTKVAAQSDILSAAPSVKIELISANGKTLLPYGDAIETGSNKLKTLLINNKHKIVMNHNSRLVIESLVANSDIGCIVRLASGQIYTHVQHDGNLFIVDTANGQAVITGTIFDVKATKNSTTLVVSEGTVRFESEKGVVNVVAGQKSKITGQSAPSIPLACNTYELTAWATGYKPNTALAQGKPNDIDLYLELPLRTDPIVLAETDYDYWVNAKQTWFKTNFPWIFEIKDALTREGIEANYPELLIKSGDVWQYVSLQRFPGRFSVPDFESLLNTAVSYGFDKEWLLENVPIARLIQDKSLLSKHPTGLDALDKLLKYVKGTEAVPYYLYPADVGRYLTETRSLIWFAVDNGKFKLTDEQRDKVLDLLQQEVIAATNCFNDLLYPEDEKKKPLCGGVCKTPEMKMAGYVEMIKAIEERIVEYAILK